MTALAVASSLCLHASAMAQGTEWQGLYAGASIAHADGKNDWDGLGRYRLKSAAIGGAFAGYRHQRGALVVAVEASGLFGKLKEKDDPDYYYKSLQDYRLKLGYAHQRTLFHVSGGYSRARFEDDGLRFNLSGYNLGVGIDFALSGSTTLGIDYTTRRFNDEKCPHDRKVDGRVSTTSIQLAYRF